MGGDGGITGQLRQSGWKVYSRFRTELLPGQLIRHPFREGLLLDRILLRTGLHQRRRRHRHCHVCRRSVQQPRHPGARGQDRHAMAPHLGPKGLSLQRERASGSAFPAQRKRHTEHLGPDLCRQQRQYLALVRKQDIQDGSGPFPGPIHRRVLPLRPASRGDECPGRSGRHHLGVLDGRAVHPGQGVGTGFHHRK